MRAQCSSDSQIARYNAAFFVFYASTFCLSVFITMLCMTNVCVRGRHYAGTDVSTYCVHPGIVSTNLARDFDGTLAVQCFNCIWSCVHGRLMTPLEGARTTLYCCLDPNIRNISGRYYRSV